MSDSIRQYQYRAPSTQQKLPFEVQPIHAIAPVYTLVQRPRRDSFYVVVVFEKGQGSYRIDAEDHRIENGSIFLIRPGQVHHWTCQTLPTGWIVIFEEQLLYTGAQFTTTNIGILNRQFQSSVILNLTEKPLMSAINVLQETHEIMNSNQRHRESLANLNLLRLLFLLDQRYAELQNIPTAEEPLIGRFFLTLNKIPIGELSVNILAEHLFITPAYLGQKIKKLTGKTAIAHINDLRILEAKRRLVHSNQHINIIADELGFTDASYFVKAFKKSTKMTPNQFRAQQKADVGEIP